MSLIYDTDDLHYYRNAKKIFFHSWQVGRAQAHPGPPLETPLVQDPLSWVSCSLAFVAAKVDSKETREMAVYGQITIHLARKHGGKGWLSYDHLFHQ